MKINFPKTVLIASGNKGKIAEFEALLLPFVQNVVGANKLNIKQPEETGKTFAENAKLKALHYYRQTGLACIADDSGLEIEKLGGMPGIYSARFAGSDANFAGAIAKIEQALKSVVMLDEKDFAQEKFSANFTCALCLCITPKTIVAAEGKVFGSVSFPAAGENGFGYDPIFTPDGYHETFGQMSSKSKETVSHRTVAWRNLLNHIG